MDTKVCTKCGETFPATEEYFYKNRSIKSGLSSACRRCTVGYMSGRYHAVLKHDPKFMARVAERARKYYLENRSEVDARNKNGPRSIGSGHRNFVGGGLRKIKSK